MVQAPPEDNQSWHGAVGDENRDESLVRAIAGREQNEKAPAARHGFLRSSGPDEQAHEQPEIVPGDVDQIALVDILPAPQPRPAHPTAVQDVSYVARRPRHLGPRHHQVALTISLPTHRHSRTPARPPTPRVDWYDTGQQVARFVGSA